MSGLSLSALNQGIDNHTKHMQRFIDTTTLLQPLPIRLSRPLATCQINEMEPSGFNIHNSILDSLAFKEHT